MINAVGEFKIDSPNGEDVERIGLTLWVPKEVKEKYDAIQEKCKASKVPKDKYFSKFCADLIVEAVNKAQT